MDFEEADLMSQTALLAMRIRRFEKTYGKKFVGKPGAIKKQWASSFDKSKARCYNCNQLGHIKSEYRVQRSAGNFQQHPHQQTYSDRPNQQTKPGPSQRSFVATDYEWTTDQGMEHNALMAGIENEVKLSPSSPACTEACKLALTDYKERLNAVVYAAIEKETEIDLLKSKLKDKDDALEILQRQKRADSEELSRYQSESSRILDLYHSAKQELESAKKLIKSWTDSSNKF
jgi:hypothetical protein